MALSLLLLVDCAAPKQSPGPEPPVPVTPFVPAPDPLPQALRLSSLQMINAQAGWALGEQAVMRTGDGGRNWIDVTPPHQEGYIRAAVQAISAEAAWVALVRDGDDAVGVFRTSDGGKTWRAAAIPKRTRGLVLGVSVASFDGRHDWLIIHPEHGMRRSSELYVSHDGGGSWTAAPVSPGVDLPAPEKVFFRSPTNGWFVGSRFNTGPYELYVTRDGGYNWEPQTLDFDPSLGQPNFPGPPTFFPPRYEEGVVEGYLRPSGPQLSEPASVLFVTQDGGRTWQSRRPVSPPGVAFFLTPRDGWLWSARRKENDLVSPVQGNLYRTRDGGKTWTVLPQDEALNRLLQAGADVTELHFVDERTGWALLSVWTRAGTGEYLLTTEDGGTTWTLLNDKSPLDSIADVGRGAQG